MLVPFDSGQGGGNVEDMRVSLALPKPQVLAVRPRCIGVAELGDKFVVSFSEAPLQPAHAAMEPWVNGFCKP